VAACDIAGCSGYVDSSNAFSMFCQVAPPVATGLPSVSGSNAAGGQQSTTKGSWSTNCGAAITDYRYKWQQDGPNNGTDIPGATSSTYVTTAADMGHSVNSAVSACDSAGCASYMPSATNSGTIVCEAPQNTTAPSVSGDGAVGWEQDVSTGSWSSGCPITYRYQWQKDGSTSGLPANSSYVPVGADIGSTLSASVTACTNSCSTVMSSNQVTVADAPVKIVEQTADYVVFQNQQAKFWIGLRCPDYGSADGSWKGANTDVGPGYISRIERLNGAVVAQPVDAAKSGGPMDPGQVALLQGVGVFGAHVARLDPGGDPTVASDRQVGVANGNYCDANPRIALTSDLGIVGGVTAWSVPQGEPRRLDSNTGEVIVDVTIGDGSVPLFKVHYNIRIHANVVDQWTTVTTLFGQRVGDPPGVTFYVKEPKLVVDLNGDDEHATTIDCRNSANIVLAFTQSNDPATPRPEGATSKCGSAVNDPANARVQAVWTGDGCDVSTDCFRVVARAAGANASPGATLTSWGGAGTGFDHWAEVAGSRTNNLSGGDGVCSGVFNGGPGDPASRRWEIYGRSPNENLRDERGVVLKAWEGGVGPSNCAMLYSPLVTGDAFGAFTAYSFGKDALSNISNPS
jgi:hypothetical protein